MIKIVTHITKLSLNISMYCFPQFVDLVSIAYFQNRFIIFQFLKMPFFPLIYIYIIIQPHTCNVTPQIKIKIPIESLQM